MVQALYEEVCSGSGADVCGVMAVILVPRVGHKVWASSKEG